eukprot:3352326-Alexandrium_andersonii.AAC.1
MHEAITAYLGQYEWAKVRGPGVSIVELIADMATYKWLEPFGQSARNRPFLAPTFAMVAKTFAAFLFEHVRAHVAPWMADAFCAKVHYQRLAPVGFCSPVMCLGVQPKWDLERWRAATIKVASLGTASVTQAKHKVDGPLEMKPRPLKTAIPFPWTAGVSGTPLLSPCPVGNPF